MTHERLFNLAIMSIELVILQYTDFKNIINYFARGSPEKYDRYFSVLTLCHCDLCYVLWLSRQFTHWLIL